MRAKSNSVSGENVEIPPTYDASGNDSQNDSKDADRGDEKHAISAIVVPSEYYTQGAKLPIKGTYDIHPTCDVFNESTLSTSSQADGNTTTINVDDSGNGNNENNENKDNKEENGASYHGTCLFLSLAVWCLGIWRGYCWAAAQCYKECKYYDSVNTNECSEYITVCDAPCEIESSESRESDLYIGVTFILVFSYLLYLSEAYGSSTAKYLHNIIDSYAMEDIVNNEWRTYKPEIKWIIQNYHEKGPPTKKESVNTEKFEKIFEYSTISEVSTVYDLNEERSKLSPIIKLQFEKKFCFENKETESAYNNQLKEFALSSIKDKKQNFHLEMNIPKFKERIVCQTQNMACFNWHWFLFWTIIGFSWIFRMYYDRKSVRKHFIIMKKISV